MDPELDPMAYEPMIDAILGVADLEQITVKKIRAALSELFSIDLSPHKKQMNEFILQRYYTLAEKLDQETEDEAKRKREEDDHRLAQKLQSESGTRTRAKRKPKAQAKSLKKVTKDKGGKERRNSVFHAELLVSSPLQQVVGSARMSRPMVVKRLWEYIKEHQLQDPNDKRRINCDDKLQAVFKKTNVGMFEMNRFLGSHLFKDGELVEPKGEKETTGPKKEEKKEMKLEIEPKKEVKAEVNGDVKDEWMDDDELSELED